MLKMDKHELDEMEDVYPGITESIYRFENATLPECPYCGSEDTAQAQCGMMGRTIHICAATTKFKLCGMGPRLGTYYCHGCKEFFSGQKIYFFLKGWCQRGSSAPKAKKRKKWQGWRLLVSGEWSESPYHQGNHTFEYSYTSDRRFWGIMRRGFPPTILAVADAGTDRDPSQDLGSMLLGTMLRGIRCKGGPYVSAINDCGGGYFDSANNYHEEVFEEDNLDIDIILAIARNRQD